MRVLLWLVEGTWQGCIDAARPLLPADADVTLLHVAPSEVEEAVGGAVAGLLGRGRPGPGRHPVEQIHALCEQAAADLLAAAQERLGRQTRTELGRGRVERLVVEPAQGFDLLVAARDGDRSRLGPASLGPAHPVRGRPRPLSGAAGLARRDTRCRVDPATALTPAAEADGAPPPPPRP